MENQEKSAVSMQFEIKNPFRVVAVVWFLLSGFLFLIFFLPNFSIVMMDFSGLKVVSQLFNDTTNIRRVFDDSNYSLMVLIMFGDVALAVVVAVAGFLAWKDKLKWWTLGMTILAAILFTLSVVGSFVIGRGGEEFVWVQKLMPRPIWGYWLGMLMQLLILLSGIAVMSLQEKMRKQKVIWG